MDYESLKQAFAGNNAGICGDYHKAAVFMPLFKMQDEIHVLFETRANDLPVQPGDISFPGGGVNRGESFQEAAIRETVEELCVIEKQVEIFGKLDCIITPYNLMIQPFVGWLDISDPNDLDFNRREVEDVFTVPLAFFLEKKPLLYRVETRACPGKDFPIKKYNWWKGLYPVYFYFYQDHIIWGITARIINNFLKYWRMSNA